MFLGDLHLVQNTSVCIGAPTKAFINNQLNLVLHLLGKYLLLPFLVVILLSSFGNLCVVDHVAFL